jgi:hypothetical protein
MEFDPTQVSSRVAAQDVAPLTFYYDGIFVSGDLWEYWRKTFPGSSVGDIFEDVKSDIDDESVESTRSLAWRGPPPS